MFKQWIVLLSLLLSLPVIQVDAQSRGNAAAPVSLQSTFDGHFPGAFDVTWEKDLSGYTAFFVKKNLKMQARYNLSEVWQYTDIIIPREMVPAAVLDHINDTYGSPAILGMGYHDSPAQRYFILEARVNQKRVMLKYDDDGNFLGME